jgi:hypothetical protein
LSLALISSTTSHATLASGEVLPYFLDASRAAFTAWEAAASVATAADAGADDDEEDADRAKSRFLATGGGVTDKRASDASKGRRRIADGSRERIIIVGLAIDKGTRRLDVVDGWLVAVSKIGVCKTKSDEPSCSLRKRSAFRDTNDLTHDVNMILNVLLCLRLRGVELGFDEDLQFGRGSIPAGSALPMFSFGV